MHVANNIKNVVHILYILNNYSYTLAENAVEAPMFRAGSMSPKGVIILSNNIVWSIEFHREVYMYQST